MTDDRDGVSLPPGLKLASSWAWRLIPIIAVLAVAFFLIATLKLIVIPLLIALLLGALLIPFSKFLQRHKVPRWLSIVIAMLTLFLALFGLLTLGITQIVRGASDLWSQTLVSWDSLKSALRDGPFHLSDTQLSNFFDQAVGTFRDSSGSVLNGVLSVGTTLGHVFAGALLAFFATLFILIDGRGIWHWILGIFPRSARAALGGAADRGWVTLQNFVKVQILVATIDALGIGLGAFFLGVPLAVPIAILVFLGSFIPIVGAVATGALAVFVALVYNGPTVAVIMLVIVLAVQQIEGHVLQPLIMGTAVKVHPLGVVVAVATGSLLAGIPGALFAVPVTAVGNVMVGYIASGVWRKAPVPETNSGADPLWKTVPKKVSDSAPESSTPRTPKSGKSTR